MVVGSLVSIGAGRGYPFPCAAFVGNRFEPVCTLSHFTPTIMHDVSRIKSKFRKVKVKEADRMVIDTYFPYCTGNVSSCNEYIVSSFQIRCSKLHL